MNERLSGINQKLEGARGLLTIAATWAMMFADTFFLNITGFSPEALKIAFLATLPITAKLVWTDLSPKLKKLLI
jgi:hypothetical protein